MLVLCANKAEAEILFYYYNPDSPQNNLSIVKSAFDSALTSISGSLDQQITFQPFSRLSDFDAQVRKKQPAIIYIPNWYLKSFGNELNIRPFLYSIRQGKSSYRKQLIINRKNPGNIIQLQHKTMAMTTMGPQSQNILNRIIFTQHRLTASNLSIVDVPKDTDAIFAVALGQVDSALVASFNLSKLQQINPRLTAAVYTAAESKPILLPVLCYIKGTISQGDLQLIKQQFMHAAQPEQKSLLEILHIDAWRPQL